MEAGCILLFFALSTLIFALLCFIMWMIDYRNVHSKRYYGKKQ
jgi:hypothetical protein